MTQAPTVRIEHSSLYPDSGGNTDVDAAVKPWGREDRETLPEETPTVQAYMSYLQRRPDSIVAAVQAIARAQGSVLVHCAAGKDRTGVVVAMTLDAAGMDREVIVSDYVATGQRVHAIFDRLLQSETYRQELTGVDPQTHAPAAQTMRRVLELIDEHSGGSADWLLTHGLAEDDLFRLCRRLSQ